MKPQRPNASVGTGTSTGGSGVRSASPTASAPAASAPTAAPTAAPAQAPVDDEPRRRDRWSTTGEMARLSDNTLRTVRFYEEAGILRPVGRTEGGHRLFERSELDRLMLVSDMREAGLSLEEIRKLLETKAAAGSGPEAAKTAIEALRKYMDDLKRKVDVLTRLHGDLAHTVETASKCLSCTHQDRFPDHCRDCDTISADKPYPRALRVLWSLGAPGGSESKAPAQAAKGAAATTGAAPTGAVTKKRA
jgi:DNA-binding transcriptional MerR regulator